MRELLSVGCAGGGRVGSTPGSALFFRRGDCLICVCVCGSRVLHELHMLVKDLIVSSI